MTVEIPLELEEFVRDAVAGGTFRSEQEVLIEALRLLKQRELLRSEVNEGVEQLDQGELIDGEVVFDRLRKRVGSASA